MFDAGLYMVDSKCYVIISGNLIECSDMKLIETYKGIPDSKRKGYFPYGYHV